MRSCLCLAAFVSTLLVAPAGWAQPLPRPNAPVASAPVSVLTHLDAPAADSAGVWPSATVALGRAAEGADVPASVVLQPGLSAEGPGCPYDVCALRLDTGLAPRVVRGRDEATALRIGFPTPSLTDLVADAPKALPHAREFERTHLPLQVVSATGLGLSVLSILPGVSTGTRTMSMLGGVLLTLASRPLLAQNRRALERAIWEYNATLER